MTPANVRRVLLLLFIALVGLGVYVANHSENTTTSRKVTRIEAASPCLTYGPKSDLCKESFEKAVLTITHPEACAILRKAGLEVVECADARLRQERIRHHERVRSKGAVDSNGHAPSSQSDPQDGGSKHIAPDGAKQLPKALPAPVVTQPSTLPTGAAPNPELEPGNSGEASAGEAHADNGVKACVDLVVSACVKSEVEAPLHLP
jgi:hypothetical protein